MGVRNRLRRGTTGLVCALALLLLPALAVLPAARAAAVRTVTTLTDSTDPNDGVHSLRELLAVAGSGDLINFAVTGTISLNGGELPITRGVTIAGPGAGKLTLSGHSQYRVLHITTAEPVSLSGLTVAGGRLLGTATQADVSGGGIFNQGGAPLFVKDCEVTGCTIDGWSSFERSLGGFALGGGIRSNGPLTLRNSTVGGNTARSGVGSQFAANAYGGGIYCGAPLTLVNSTVAENTAEVPNPGGQSFGAGIYATQDGSVVASTIARNEAKAYSGANGGGVFLSNGPFVVRDSIVAANSSRVNGVLQPSDLNGGFTSQGFNLIGAGDGSHAPGSAASPWIGTDLTGAAAAPIDPRIVALGSYGGQTETCALLADSPALNVGDDAVLAAPVSVNTDQRALPRRLGPHVDIGAFERDVPQPGPSFVVNTLDDVNDGVPGAMQCSLREAVLAANATDDVNTITFQSGLAGTIFNTGFAGTLKITNPVIIAGPGARVLAVSGFRSGRVFWVTGQGVTISGLTIRDGFVPILRRIEAQPAAANDGADGPGGGVLNEGSLTLTNCALLNNIADAGGGTQGGNGGRALGGAVSNTGALTLNGCTLAGNQAQGGRGDATSASFGGLALGGALYNEGTLSLTNCTLAGNEAQGGDGGDPSGGAFGLGGAIYNNLGTLSLLSCTVAGNKALGGRNGSMVARPTQGGGIGLFGGAVTIRNTLLARNTATSDPDAFGSGFGSDGTNLVGVTNGSSGWTAHDRTGTAAVPLDPKLSPLANNGGPTDTLLPNAGSPALNAANPNTAPARDQRNYIRNGPPEIGACEYLGVAPLAPLDDGVNPSSGSSLAGAARSFVCSYRDGNGAYDLQVVYFLANTSPSGAGALFCYYDCVTNKLFLRNNAGTAWLGGFAPGSSQVISDPSGRGSLNCAATTVTRSGNLLQVSWSLVPNASLGGSKNLYLSCLDREGLSDGWDLLGSWEVQSPPVNGFVNPSSGSSAAGTARTITASYSDPNGSGDLAGVCLYVGTTPGAVGGLWAFYDAVTDRLYLRNGANSGWLGGFAPGSANTISGPSGSLDCSATHASKSATSLAITWTVTPAAGFTGAKNVYLLCRDSAGQQDAWEQRGTWTISP